MSKLCVLTSEMKPLPKERWLTMQLLYNDTVPDDYDPARAQPQAPR